MKWFFVSWILFQMKSIWGRGFFAGLLIFGIIFGSKDLEATPCQTNSDCVLVSADCCGCNANGKSTAIHRSLEADYWRALNQYCSARVTACSQVTICRNIQVECRNSRCVATGPKTVSSGNSVVKIENPSKTAPPPASNPGGGEKNQGNTAAAEAGQGSNLDDGSEENQGNTAAAGAGQAANNKMPGIHTENKKRIDSATRKIDKHRKFLAFSAIANVAVGAYLLNRQCNPTPYHMGVPAPNPGADTGPIEITPATFAQKLVKARVLGGPPNTIHGCIMGPLALAQGIAHFKQRQSLKKTRQKLEGVSLGINGNMPGGGGPGSGGPGSGVPGDEAPGGGSSGGGSGDEEEELQIPDLEVPCPDDPSQTCQLTDEGETMTPSGGGGGGGGEPKPISEIAGDLPTSSDDPEEQTEIDARIEALEEAVKANQDLIDKANELNPNTGSQSVAGSDPATPSFNFDPLGIGSGSGVNSGTGAASISGLSDFDDVGGNTPELPAPPEGVYGPGGDSLGGGSFAGNVEGDSVGGDSSNDDGRSPAYAIYGRRTIRGSRSNSPSSDNKNSMTFGTDRVATVNTDILGAIHDRYQVFRDSGQFIPPSASGPVMTPTIPKAQE